MMTFNIKKSIAVVFLCCGIGAVTTGCEDMFETDSNRQIFDPALDQKTDSMFYTLGILKGLQLAADQYVMTGEMRGDLVATNQYTETDLRRLADFSADVTNKYDSAYVYYRIINNCNYYIAHRDTTLRTGSRQVAIPEYAEALAIRAWAYMQLAKNYGTVPFYTDPLVSIDDANSLKEIKDLQGICDALAPELMKFSGTPVPDYGEVSAGVLNSSESDNPQEKRIKSRNAMLPVDLVLGDLFLETHQYEQAARYYFNFLRANEWVAAQAYISLMDSYFLRIFDDRMPSSFSMTVSNGYEWSSIFNVSADNDDIIVILSVFLNGFDCAAAPFGCVAACLGNCIRNCALNGSAGDGRTGYTVHGKGLCFYYLSRNDFQRLDTDTGSFVVFHNGDLCNLIILDRNLNVDRAVHALCRGRIGSVCHHIVFRPCAGCGQGQKEAEENCQEFLHYDLLSHISIHRCLMIGDCRIAYVKHIRSLNNITLIKNKCNMKQKRIKNNGPLWDSHLTTGRHF